MKNYERKIKLKFRLISSFYDLFDTPFKMFPTGNPRRALAQKIPDASLRILDVCVGTANSALAVAQNNSLNHVIGIDLSPDMVAVAKNKIRKKGISNIEIQQMDATNLHFKNGEFDIVMISFALHEMDALLMEGALNEIARVTKTDGTLYIIDYEKPEDDWKSFLFSVYLKLFEPAHMDRFLQYDWKDVLCKHGFQIINSEK